MTIRHLIALFGAALVGPAWGQQFSADIVDLRAEGTPFVAKFHSTPEKKRFDMQPAAGKGAIVIHLTDPMAASGADLQVSTSGAALIMDFSTNVSTLLSTYAKTYGTDSLRRLTPSEKFSYYAYVHPKSVDDACQEWMSSPRAKGETCRKVGEEPVNSRSTVKYELSCNGELCQLWIDRSLHVLVKRESSGTSTELRNIKEEVQPDELFAVPADYKEGQIGGVIHHRDPE